MFIQESESVRRYIILNSVSMPKDVSRSQTVMFAVKVIIYRKRCMVVKYLK